MHAEATNARNRGKRRGKWKSWREAKREENERNICGGNDGDDDEIDKHEIDKHASEPEGETTFF